MTRTIFLEFAVEIDDNTETLEALAGLQVSISGDDVKDWQLAHVCDDENDPINFLS